MSGRHAALVLAAGAGRRFGGCKQLLTHEGETLVHRAARLAVATVPTRVLVTVGAQAGPVAAALEGLPCILIPVPEWHAGLAAGLHAAAGRLDASQDAVLVLACDQPALRADHLLRLLDGAWRARSGAAATLHGPHPGIPAVIPAHWFRDAPRTGDHGFGARLRALPRDTLFGLDAPELHLDIDTPADADEAIARGWLDPDPVAVMRS